MGKWQKLPEGVVIRDIVKPKGVEADAETPRVQRRVALKGRRGK